MENKINRLDPDFNRELEEIQKELLKENIGKKECSIRALTSMIIKHKNWLEMKNDLYAYIVKQNGK